MEVNSIQSSHTRVANLKQEIGAKNASEQYSDPQDLFYQKKSVVQNEIAGINKLLQSTNTHLKFTLHEELNEYYVQVIDEQTNEVVKEIPSKKVMDIVAKMHEMIGLLVDEKR